MCAPYNRIIFIVIVQESTMKLNIYFYMYTYNSVCHWHHCTADEKKLMSDLRISSLQCGLCSPTDSDFTPESCRSLLLRSSSLREDDWELRTEDRDSQLLSDRLQPLSLKKKKTSHTTEDISLCLIELTVVFWHTVSGQCLKRELVKWQENNDNMEEQLWFTLYISFLILT